MSLRDWSDSICDAVFHSCSCTRVIDGDTFVADIHLGYDLTLSDQRIRLYGIDTPEIRTKDADEKVRGLAATDFAAERLLDNGGIRLECKGKDSLGRWLCKVYYYQDGWHLLNTELVDTGHAEHFKLTKGE